MCMPLASPSLKSLSIIQKSTVTAQLLNNSASKGMSIRACKVEPKLIHRIQWMANSLQFCTPRQKPELLAWVCRGLWSLQGTLKLGNVTYYKVQKHGDQSLTPIQKESEICP